jgi:outer membrane protein, multidrug efflux system
MRPRAAALALVLCIAGCAAPLPSNSLIETPVIPLAWQGQHGLGATEAQAVPAASPIAQWWLRFDDPMLSNLIEQALRANTSVNTSLAVLQQARALRDAAAAALWPVGVGMASAQRVKDGERPSTNALRLGLDASYELDLFGARRQARQAGDAVVEASMASLGDMRVTVAAELALTYLTLRSGQARLAIAEANLDSQLHTLQIVEWRRQAGLVGALDVEQSRSAAQQTRALLPALKTATLQSRHALAVLCGLPPAAMENLLSPVAKLPRAADDLVLAIPVDTLRQRPDVRAAEWQLQAAASRVAQAEAARLPSFRLAGTLGLAAGTLGALGEGAALTRSLLASLALPLFDGGSARAQVRLQQAAHTQAHEAWRASVLRALQEVEDTLAALQGDRERSLSLGLAVQAAAKAAQLALQSYRSGLVDYQRVLETQRNQLATQDSLANAEASFSGNQVRLFKVLGGGWDAVLVAGATARQNQPAAAPPSQTHPP